MTAGAATPASSFRSAGEIADTGGVARTNDEDKGEEKEKRGIRRRISERAMKIPFLRRRTVKRMIKYIDKSKEKGRRLPPEMQELSRFLARVPKADRAKRLEEALLAQQSAESGEQAFNRDLRRAAANQQRRSGKNPAGYRPGSLPRSQQPGRKPSKPR